MMIQGAGSEPLIQELIGLNVEVIQRQAERGHLLTSFEVASIYMAVAFHFARRGFSESLIRSFSPGWSSQMAKQMLDRQLTELVKAERN